MARVDDGLGWKSVAEGAERGEQAEQPEVAVGPYFLPWTATDARFFRAAGLPTYGFSPFPLTVTETLQIALPNERMQLPAYVAGVALYRELVARLADRPWDER